MKLIKHTYTEKYRKKKHTKTTILKSSGNYLLHYYYNYIKYSQLS